MSPLTKNQTTAAIIAALAVIIAALITAFGPTIIQWFVHGKKTAHINGVVSDTFDKAPIPGVLVRLETNDGMSDLPPISDHVRIRQLSVAPSPV